MKPRPNFTRPRPLLLGVVGIQGNWPELAAVNKRKLTGRVGLVVEHLEKKQWEHVARACRDHKYSECGWYKRNGVLVTPRMRVRGSWSSDVHKLTPVSDSYLFTSALCDALTLVRLDKSAEIVAERQKLWAKFGYSDDWIEDCTSAPSTADSEDLFPYAFAMPELKPLV